MMVAAALKLRNFLLRQRIMQTMDAELKGRRNKKHNSTRNDILIQMSAVEVGGGGRVPGTVRTMSTTPG
jgi:hypothetical protein